jgi:hypothetical protein
MGATSVVRYSNYRGLYRIGVIMVTSFEAFELMGHFIYPRRKPHLVVFSAARPVQISISGESRA